MKIALDKIAKLIELNIERFFLVSCLIQSKGEKFYIFKICFPMG